MSLVSFFLGAASAGTVDRIAAVVNDDVIVLSEVYDLGGDFIAERTDASDPARRVAELEVLDSLVMRRLISQEIEKLGLDVTEPELDRTIDEIARRNSIDRDALKAEVERGGLEWIQYRAELRENLRQNKFSQMVIQPRINVNEDELLDAYRRMVAEAGLPLVADLGAIFFRFEAEGDPEATVAKAEGVRQQFVDGADFVTLSKEHDQSIYGENDGKMGTYRQGELVADLDEPGFSTEVGGLSEPVVTEQGVFLIHVFDRREEDPPGFEDMRETVLQEVYAGRIEDETDQWYQQAKRRASVVIKLQEM